MELLDAIPFHKDPFRISGSDLPRFYKVRQKIDAPIIKDIAGTVKSELTRVNVAASIKPGARVAITAGSRGITNLPALVRATADYVKAAGGNPVVLPTMGSHGGATADGQRDMLAGLGVTEESAGCPVMATMEVVPIGETADGIPVYLDKNAAESDAIIVLARVKQHTDFDAPIESGLHKMMVIGLGKHKGAIEAHRRSLTLGFPKIIPEIGQVVLHNTVTPIIAGLAVVENAYDQTAIIEAVPPSGFIEREKALLEEAKMLIGKIPFRQMDILIVDEAGKNVSGNGMDTNVTGRVMSKAGTPPEFPKITRIILRGLTEETHGNASGIGQADFVLRRCAEQVVWHHTYMNVITGMGPEYGRCPIVAAHDQQALGWSFHTAGMASPKNTRIVWIKSTMELGDLYVSEGMIEEVKANPRLEVISEAETLDFDATGHLPNLL